MVAVETAPIWRILMVFRGFPRSGRGLYFTKAAITDRRLSEYKLNKKTGIVHVAAIVFDVRSAERKLKAAGASEELAEATADLMSEAVLLNLDALVTRDYLDARLDARFSELEVRFTEIDSRFKEIDARFEATNGRIDGLRTELKSEIDALRTEQKSEFRLVHAMLALLMAGVFIPQLQSWLGG